MEKKWQVPHKKSIPYPGLRYKTEVRSARLGLCGTARSILRDGNIHLLASGSIFPKKSGADHDMMSKD
jgi:hypothetical protein